jgi:GMP synthase-like glutamine amidotransferase
MRVLSLIHQEDAPIGVFADEIDDVEEASFALDRPPGAASGYDATIILGGKANVDEEQKRPWLRPEKAFIRELVERGRPVLGVCLGAQLIAEAAGAWVGPLDGGMEIGWRDVELLNGDDPVLGVMPQRFRALEWHGYHALLPPGAQALARNEVGLQAFRLGGKPIWGIQFHAEATGATLDEWIAQEKEPPAGIAGDNTDELAHWNELGRRLCRAFLTQAAR